MTDAGAAHEARANLLAAELWSATQRIDEQRREIRALRAALEAAQRASRADSDGATE